MVSCVLSLPQNAAASNSLLGVGALVAGNSLVVKAPRSCPLGVAWVWRELVVPLLDEFGAPPGTLGNHLWRSAVVIDQWIDNPHVDDIMFVGASARGIDIGKRCVEAGKKPVLELAGNDGVLVWEDADLESAARALAECFYGSSQICMVPKYAVVHPRVADQVIDLLVKQIAEVRPGAPEDPATLLTPVLKTQEFFEVLAEAGRNPARGRWPAVSVSTRTVCRVRLACFCSRPWSVSTVWRPPGGCGRCVRRRPTRCCRWSSPSLLSRNRCCALAWNSWRATSTGCATPCGLKRIPEIICSFS